MLDFYLCEHNDYSNCCYCFFRDYLYMCSVWGFSLCVFLLAHSLSPSLTLSGFNAIVISKIFMTVDGANNTF